MSVQVREAEKRVKVIESEQLSNTKTSKRRQKITKVRDDRTIFMDVSLSKSTIKRKKTCISFN